MTGLSDPTPDTLAVRARCEFEKVYVYENKISNIAFVQVLHRKAFSSANLF